MSTVKIPDGHPSFDKLTLTHTTLAGTTVFPTGAKIQIGNNPASGTIATTAFVNRRIGELVANAPATLDTLKELATSLGDLPNLKGYVDSELALKANKDGSNLTGIANISGKTITLEGNLTHAGNFAQTFTATGPTNVNLPTSGTLATLAGSETLTNKTFVAPLLGAATASSVNKVAFTQPANSATLTLADGTTLSTAANVSHTGSAQIFRATSATDVTLPTTGTLATLAGTETLTNKTITTSGLLTASNGLTVASGALIVNGGSIDTTDQNEEVKLFDSAQNLYIGGKSSNIYIGTDNTGSSTNVTIGASNDKVFILGELNVTGSTVTVNTTNLEVTDKLITLNKGGNAGSVGETGFTIEANGQADAAYLKVHTDSAKFAIKLPNLENGVEQYIATKDTNDDFKAR